jgi:hypothetical protein
MALQNQNSSDLNELESQNLNQVSGGYLGVDPDIEAGYHAIVKRAQSAADAGDMLINSYDANGKIVQGIFTTDDWEILAVFYKQVHKSGMPFFDPLMEIIDEQTKSF